MVLRSDVPKGGRDTDLQASGILPSQRSSVLFSRVRLATYCLKVGKLDRKLHELKSPRTKLSASREIICRAWTVWAISESACTALAEGVTYTTVKNSSLCVCVCVCVCVLCVCVCVCFVSVVFCLLLF